MKRPLTGNPTAKELKRFFRDQHIKYLTVHKTIVPECKSFPPLVFTFDGQTVTVWNKTDNSKIIHINAPTINQLFLKLIKFRFATPKQLTI